MKLVLQRVKEASVTVNGKQTGIIGPGMVVFLCIEKGDDATLADHYSRKVTEIRIFEDEQGKMNHSILETGGEVLLISQFTLAADVEKGRRPSFEKAAAPDEAEPLYRYVSQKISETGVPVVNGIFQAFMQVALVNDGPVTIILGKEKPVK